MALLCVNTVMFSCVYVTCQYGVPGQVWYLIVLIPDLCLPLNCDCGISWSNSLDFRHTWVKVQNFINPELLKSNLKTCSMPININNFMFKWSIVLRLTENKTKKLLESA